MKAEAVAYLAALRCSDTGLRKHAERQATWDLQRREDAGEEVGTIPVPPRYAKPDFTGAGWEHRDRAKALAGWYLQARRDGRPAAHLTPLLAGLAELVPWLKQWHDDADPDPALDRPGTQIAALVETELRALSLTAGDLRSWRPPSKARRRAATN